MTEVEWKDDGDLSLFAIGTTLIRTRWITACWMIVCTVIALVPAVVTPVSYAASASFGRQGADANRTGIATLAGQFGVALASGDQSQSPEFYANLLKSREVLGSVARDTFAVAELGGKRLAFFELFGIRETTSSRREEDGVKRLRKIITIAVVKTTGVVEFSVKTRWPSVSLAIVTSLLHGVDDFNQRARQSQAAAERNFVEGRLAVAGDDLRGAEDRLQGFLKANRQFASSPELVFEHDRLQRDVESRQQVVTSLTQSFEDARIREVRDTPLITVIDSPAVSTRPVPRGWIVRVLLGVLVGGFVGFAWAFSTGAIARRRALGDTEADEFVRALGDLTGGLFGRVARPGTRAGQ